MSDFDPNLDQAALSLLQFLKQVHEKLLGDQIQRFMPRRERYLVPTPPHWAIGQFRRHFRKLPTQDPRFIPLLEKLTEEGGIATLSVNEIVAMDHLEALLGKLNGGARRRRVGIIGFVKVGAATPQETRRRC